MSSTSHGWWAHIIVEGGAVPRASLPQQTTLAMAPACQTQVVHESEGSYNLLHLRGVRLHMGR